MKILCQAPGSRLDFICATRDFSSIRARRASMLDTILVAGGVGFFVVAVL